MKPGADVGEAAEDDAVDGGCVLQRLDGRCERDACRALGGKTIDAGGNGRKGNRSQAVALAEFDDAGIAGRQRPILAPVTALPYWPDGVDHMPGWKPITGRDLGIAGRTAMKRAAFGKQLRSGRAMNSAINAAAAE